MIYEFRTYDLKPGRCRVRERTYAKCRTDRETIPDLFGFWQTEAGPLNQVLHTGHTKTSTSVPRFGPR